MRNRIAEVFGIRLIFGSLLKPIDDCVRRTGEAVSSIRAVVDPLLPFDCDEVLPLRFTSLLSQGFKS